MPDHQPLILIGASVRAAAQSAVRAGFSPWCIDQFGDEDTLQAASQVRVVSEWPDGISSAITDFTNENSDIEWLYAGALENCRQLVSSLSKSGRLLGCDSGVLRRVRNPEWISDALLSAGLPALSVLVPASTSDFDAATFRDKSQGNWLVKPLSSAAGIGIRELSSRSSEVVSPLAYLQQKVIGRTISGLYIGYGSSAQLLGLCEQLCGEAEAGAAGYLYCGSLGPLSRSDIPESVFEQAQQISSVVVKQLNAEDVQIAGLFGIDFILGEDGEELWALEINPRYTASVELYERAFNWPLIRWHVDACRGTKPGTSQCPLPGLRDTSFTCQGKLIVYSPKDFVAPDLAIIAKQLDSPVNTSFSVADIPRAGTTIHQGQPVCTLLTDGPGIDQCRTDLLSSAFALRDFIRNMPD